MKPDDQAFVFSYELDYARPCNPDGVGHRYVAMCAGLGIDSHLHALRPYSATELIAAGVDIRTVAGRLGHGGGGTTTLRVYAAWVAESDKRAADILARKMTRPAAPGGDVTGNVVPLRHQGARRVSQRTARRRVARRVR